MMFLFGGTVIGYKIQEERGLFLKDAFHCALSHTGMRKNKGCCNENSENFYGNWQKGSDIGWVERKKFVYPDFGLWMKIFQNYMTKLIF